MRYVFLIYRYADKARLRNLMAELTDLNGALKHPIEVMITDYAGHAQELVRRVADTYGSDAIVFACGGDGTAHEVANALVGTDTPMTVFPMGTGNDFARSVLSEADYRAPHRLLRRLDQIDIRKIDTMRVRSFDKDHQLQPAWSRYSLNVTSFGLDTMVQAKAKKIIEKTGNRALIRKNAYTVAVISSLMEGWNFKMHYDITLADQNKSVSGDISYILLAACNGPYYGKGFCPAPQADKEDQVIDICMVEDMPVCHVIPMVPRYKKGRHLDHPNVTYLRAVRAVFTSLDADQLLKGNFDGEDFWGHEVHIEVVPASLSYAFFSI